MENKVALRPARPEDTHRETRLARYTHEAVCDWLTTSQSWVFIGGNGVIVGDALVVVTGRSFHSQVYAVIRLGDVVRVVACQGIRGALQACGVEAFVEIV